MDARTEPQLSEDAAALDSGDVIAIFADLDSLPLGDRIARLARDNTDQDSSWPKPVGATVTYSNAVTGDQRIDETTERLTKTLKGVMNTFDFIPYSTPRLCGTAVHSAFGAAVLLDNLQKRRSRIQRHKRKRSGVR